MKPDSEKTKSATETATYIGGLAHELRAMASKDELGFLAYLLAMVEDDAAATVRRLNNTNPEI